MKFHFPVRTALVAASLTALMAVSIAVFARNLKKRGAYDTEV